MPGLRARLTAKVGGVLTKVMNRLEPGTTVSLCKASATEREYEDVLVLEGKFFFEYKSFRQQLQLEISDDSPELTAAIAEATHMKIDGEVYVIANGDTLPPKGTDVTWKLFSERFENRGQFKGLFG